MADKDVRQLIRTLRDQGFVVVETKSNHWSVYRADGDEKIATLAGTASDHRSLANAKAVLRRAGWKDPKRPHRPRF